MVYEIIPTYSNWVGCHALHTLKQPEFFSLLNYNLGPGYVGKCLCNDGWYLGHTFGTIHKENT